MPGLIRLTDWTAESMPIDNRYLASKGNGFWIKLPFYGVLKFTLTGIPVCAMVNLTVRSFGEYARTNFEL